MQLLLYSCFSVVGLGISWIVQSSGIFLLSPHKKYPKYPTFSLQNYDLVGEILWPLSAKATSVTCLPHDFPYLYLLLAHHPHTVLMQSYWLTLCPVNLSLGFSKIKLMILQTLEEI